MFRKTPNTVRNERTQFGRATYFGYNSVGVRWFVTDNSEKEAIPNYATCSVFEDSFGAGQAGAPADPPSVHNRNVRPNRLFAETLSCSNFSPF